MVEYKKESKKHTNQRRGNAKCADMAQLEQSGARPVDEEANTAVLGFNEHQTFKVKCED